MVGLLEASATLTKAYADRIHAWWPIDSAYYAAAGGDPRFEILVGAILTQNTSWTNVDKALDNLRRLRLLEPRRMARIELKTLREAVRPAGFFNQKSAYLRALALRIANRHGGDLGAFLSQPQEALRTDLLSIKGIGEETADDILLYAANRPYFVVDAYTRRLLHRLGIAGSTDSYAALQKRWHRALPREPERYRRIHAAVVEHAKVRCTAKLPKCPGCPLEDVCKKVDVEAEVYLQPRS